MSDAIYNYNHDKYAWIIYHVLSFYFEQTLTFSGSQAYQGNIKCRVLYNFNTVLSAMPGLNQQSGHPHPRYQSAVFKANKHISTENASDQTSVDRDCMHLLNRQTVASAMMKERVSTESILQKNSYFQLQFTCTYWEAYQVFSKSASLPNLRRNACMGHEAW